MLACIQLTALYDNEVEADLADAVAVALGIVSEAATNLDAATSGSGAADEQADQSQTAIQRRTERERALVLMPGRAAKPALSCWRSWSKRRGGSVAAARFGVAALPIRVQEVFQGGKDKRRTRA